MHTTLTQAALFNAEDGAGGGWHVDVHILHLTVVFRQPSFLQEVVGAGWVKGIPGRLSLARTRMKCQVRDLSHSNRFILN